MARRKVDPTWFDEADQEEEPAQICEYLVEAGSDGLRLDVFLVEQLPQRSRSLIQDWIEGGRVLLDGRPGKASTRLKPGQEVLVEVPPLEPAEPQAEHIPLQILYEDTELLVLNKHRGLVIHPAGSHRQGTLVNALLGHCRDLSGIRGVEKPGIVHRLDKDTTGVMVVAKTDAAHLGLSLQFQQRQVSKFYQALVHGIPASSRGRIEQPVARHEVDRKRMTVHPRGKTAITDYQVVESFPEAGKGFAHVDLQIHTGRTHQIRVHMAWLGHPLVGDPVYGRRSNPWGFEGQALHCRLLGFRHPSDHRPLEFSAEPPDDYRQLLEELRRS